jgi:hypothetical protein
MRAHNLSNSAWRVRREQVSMVMPAMAPFVSMTEIMPCRARRRKRRNARTRRFRPAAAPAIGDKSFHVASLAVMVAGNAMADAAAVHYPAAIR